MIEEQSMIDTNTSAEIDYDIIVIGGGMVGAAFACLMQNSALKIAVIEARTPDFNWPKNSHDIRVSAITHASQQLLSHLQVWDELKHLGAYAYDGMQVWDKEGDGRVVFDAKEIQQADLGHIIENRHIQKALIEKMLQYENIDYIHPFVSKQLIKTTTGYELLAEDGRRLSTRLIVGADGANSWCREQAGISLTQWAYMQTAVVTTVKTSEHHQNTCWQQFMPQGPLAFLPLDQHYSSMVWSTSPEHAEHLLSLCKQDLAIEIQQLFRQDLGDFSIASDVAGFPLKMRHAQNYVKENLVLIGDAIHTVHPLAGQGVNLGFLDAVALAKVMKTALAKQRNYASFATLRKFERERKGSNVTMLAAMDAFKRGFGSQNVGIKLLRNQGLNWVNDSRWLRKFFTQYALGDTPDLGSESK